MRLRRAVGDVVVRSGSGVRLAPDVTCDLHDFERLAADALASARADPELAGRLANDAVAIADGTVFVDFEYEEWALSARRAAEQQLINLLDLLSVQAEDAGDLPLAQALAERALRLDRYADSRYVRLAELLTLQTPGGGGHRRARRRRRGGPRDGGRAPLVSRAPPPRPRQEGRDRQLSGVRASAGPAATAGRTATGARFESATCRRGMATMMGVVGVRSASHHVPRTRTHGPVTGRGFRSTAS